MPEPKTVTFPIVPSASHHNRESYSVMTYHTFDRAIRSYTMNDIINSPSMVTTLRTMQVDCPHPACTAKAGEYCNNPRMTVPIHMARWRKSFDEGWWEPGVAISVTVPARGQNVPMYVSRIVARDEHGTRVANFDPPKEI